jgi:hypothetical protein
MSVDAFPNSEIILHQTEDGRTEKLGWGRSAASSGKENVVFLYMSS